MLSIDHSFHFLQIQKYLRKQIAIKCLFVYSWIVRVNNFFLSLTKISCLSWFLQTKIQKLIHLPLTSEIYHQQVLKWSSITIIKKEIMLSHKLWVIRYFVCLNCPWDYGQAWLWLWGINIGYTKLGQFLSKSYLAW